MFQVVSIGTNSGRQRFRLFRRPISRRRAGPMHRGRRRGPSGGNTTNRKEKASRCEYRKNVVPPDGCGCGVTPSCPDVRPRPCAPWSLRIAIGVESPAVSSCPVAVPIASAEKWILRAHEGNPAWCQTQTSQRGRFPTTCCCSVFTFTFQLFTVWAVAPMASRSSLERTLPRGLAGARRRRVRHRVPMVNA